MANWKKVIVSGSAAHLLNVTASNLTENDLVIAGAGGALESSGLTYNGSVLNLGTTQVSASGFTGSFTGSFTGDGAGLTGIVATGTSLQNAIASGEGIAPFSYTNIAPVSVAVSGAVDLTDNAITKWDNNDGKFQTSSLIDNGTVISGVTSIQLSGANSSLTGSFTGSFSGDGSGLTGLPTTLNFGGDSGASSVNLLTQTLAISGSANEIVTSVSGQTVTVGLPDNVTITSNLTVGGDLFVQGNTTQINTTQLLVEDPFILLASGSTGEIDGGIIIDRGGYSSGNIGFGYDAETDRWGYQNGLADDSTSLTLADGSGTTAAFAGLVFTETAHGTTKPTTGEFAQKGAIYTATDGDIWMYS